ncbi:MAG: carboxypeptidase-like regulatory domain-containing protein [Muribaculaceae bacterium]|nr:carboxypeptidase-like regulatory domain-containing protein [Muribaculaceae bacterium]
MKFERLPFLLLIFLSLSVIHSKGEEITGKVSDIEGKPVRGAIVKLLEKNGSTLAFSTSKTRGEYSITFSDTIALNCIIIFSHSKFETLSLPLSEIKRNPDVTLTPGSRELQEIVVLPKAVRAKGDTILYSVDALRHASDRNVDDFIAHLPGMSVDSQ